MNNESNHRAKKRLRKRAKKGGFTFIGGTPEKIEEKGNRDQLIQIFAQNQLMIEQLFPLSNSQIGDRVMIAQFLSGQNMERRLSQVGLTLGSEVQVISKTASGSVIVCLQDEQIGLGAGMANRVIVTFVAEE